MKSKQSKPVRLFKAFVGCSVLFCVPGLILTFVSPSFTIELTRMDAERIDAKVYKQVLFLVPIAKYTATHLQEAESTTIDGGVIREGHRSTGRVVGHAEDDGLLLLRGRDDRVIEVWISPRSLDQIREEVDHFINDSQEPSAHLWVVSNWKFGAILPGLLLLFCAAAFLASAWSIIMGKSLETRISKCGTAPD